MDLMLRNEDTREFRTLKNGASLYFLLMFIPIVGTLIVLIMSIIRKQFKILLSLFIWIIIFYVILLVFLIIIAIVPVLNIIYIIIALFELLFIIYMVVMIAMNANYWSYNKYIEKEYIVENEDDEGIAEFIEKANFKYKPFWLFFI